VTGRPDLGPPPRLGYIENPLDRAALLRNDAAAMAKFAAQDRAIVYVIGGENIVMKAKGGANQPLFTPAEAHALGAVRDTVFLGLLGDVPRFGFSLDAQAIEPLKARIDPTITDLRSIAVQGLVDAQHLPPLAEAKALLGWHARHRFCPNCGSPTQAVQAGWRRD
jgi:NAD+ diphosphatase